MIRIRKPSKAPSILAKKGTALREAVCAKHAAHRGDYDSGDMTFEFNSKVYGAKSVKNALKKAQHDKCCFCESKISHISYGDVEHFRPKGGYRQQESDPLGRPGYYWLAYEWSNLFLSCTLCNQRFKANLFPLVDADRRATCHENDIAQEQPVFLDPARDDPEQHIEFEREVPRPRNGSSRGRATILALELDSRPDLTERRRELYVLLKTLYEVATGGDALTNPRLGEEARQHLEARCRDNAEYASMVRCALKNGFN